MRYLLLIAAAWIGLGCEDGELSPDNKPAETAPAAQGEDVLIAAPAQQQEPTEQQLADLRAIAKANNQFAFDLYGQLRKEQGNLFYSPASISSALSMALAGGRSQTSEQMREVLHFDLADDRLHAGFAALRTQLLSDKAGLQVRVANRLWGQAGYNFVPGFLKTTRENYGAEMGVVDFRGNTEAARQEINTWVEDETNNKITDLIPAGSLDSYTRMVLTNAIYFKGEWQHKFDANSTHDGTFQVSSDEEVTVKFMRKNARFRYGKSDGFACLEMPYKDGKCSMWILLPNHLDGLADLETQLDAEKLEQYLADAEPRSVITQVPKFSLSSEFQLNGVLEDLGMADAFDPDAADFSGITDEEELSITAVVHKAFVDVNEKGTEAAAATGIAFGATSAQIDPTVFRADHPFMYLIRDNETGCILFMGRVVNPQ